MAKSFNKIQLIGILGHKPVLKHPPNGKSYTRLSLATKDGSGDYKKTNWHQVVLYGRVAENAAEYLDKGSLVFVEGILAYSKFEKNGTEIRDASITAFTVIYLDRKPEGVTKKLPSDEEPPW